MNITFNLRSLFAVIQFLSLILILGSWWGPIAVFHTDSDFESHLAHVDEDLLFQYTQRKSRQVRHIRTFGLTSSVLIFVVSTVGAWRSGQGSFEQ